MKVRLKYEYHDWLPIGIYGHWQCWVIKTDHCCKPPISTPACSAYGLTPEEAKARAILLARHVLKDRKGSAPEPPPDEEIEL